LAVAPLFLLSALLFLPFAAFGHDCDLEPIIARIFYLKVAENSFFWHSTKKDMDTVTDGRLGDSTSLQAVRAICSLNLDLRFQQSEITARDHKKRARRELADAGFLFPFLLSFFSSFLLFGFLFEYQVSSSYSR
jgi:hypothetical protein